MSTETVFDTITLIEAVKKRPGLYNKENPNYYSPKYKKSLLWSQIQKELIPNWDSLRPHDKLRLGLEIQKRWKNLRTCFVRELTMQVQEKEKRDNNEPYKRRKIYSYFKRLSFLLPHTQLGSSIEYERDGDEIIINDDHIAELGDDEEDVEETTPRQKRFKTETVYEEIPISGNEEDPIDSDLLPSFLEDNVNNTGDKDFLNRSKPEEDEDKQFLLSLLSSFRKFDERQKFDAKIEILKVMREITFRNDDSSQLAQSSQR